jgi:hypothetical protein
MFRLFIAIALLIAWQSFPAFAWEPTEMAKLEQLEAQSGQSNNRNLPLDERIVRLEVQILGGPQYGPIGQRLQAIEGRLSGNGQNGPYGQNGNAPYGQGGNDPYGHSQQDPYRQYAPPQENPYQGYRPPGEGPQGSRNQYDRRQRRQYQPPVDRRYESRQDSFSRRSGYQRDRYQQDRYQQRSSGYQRDPYQQTPYQQEGQNPYQQSPNQNNSNDRNPYEQNPYGQQQADYVPQENQGGKSWGFVPDNSKSRHFNSGQTYRSRKNAKPVSKSTSKTSTSKSAAHKSVPASKAQPSKTTKLPSGTGLLDNKPKPLPKTEGGGGLMGGMQGPPKLAPPVSKD